MLQQGFELMVIGMGVVFAFLLLLVWLVTLTGKVLQRFSEPDPVAPAARLPSAGPSVGPSPVEIVALAAARRARAAATTMADR